MLDMTRRQTIERIEVDRNGEYRPFKLGPLDELEMRSDGRGNLTAIYITRVAEDDRISKSRVPPEVHKAREFK
jgi:hypothetical protein